MTQGILIFAHNSKSLDYARMAVIAGGLAKKHLSKPVSLVTDSSTQSWIKESGISEMVESVFDNVILADRPGTDNQRSLFDGNRRETVPFLNNNRSSAFELSPYDQTLLIDSDYFIFSSCLNNYWSHTLAISTAVKDIHHTNRFCYNDRYISDTGIKMYWATNFIFSKDEKSKLFFDLLSHVKENYKHYSDIFRFDHRMFRNDIAFSLAKHMLDGYLENGITDLPSVKTAIDKDMLHQVHNDGRIDFLVSVDNNTNYALASFKGVDIHVMNKQSIVRNFDKLKNLI
jgi:hypothetical protein